MKRGRGKERRAEDLRKRDTYGSQHRMSPQFFKNNVDECGMCVCRVRTTVRNDGTWDRIIRVGHRPCIPINVKRVHWGQRTRDKVPSCFPHDDRVCVGPI